MNIGTLLEMVAEASPERLAITTDGSTLDYGGLLRRANAAAAWLARRRVGMLGFVGVNSAALPVALFGAARAGVPFSPLTYRAGDEQLRAAAARLAPGLIIADAEALERLGGIDNVAVVERTRFLAELTDGTGASDAASDATAPAVLLFTSGTSGDPKIAMLRHNNLSSYILASVDLLGADPDEANLISVPPYHVAGIAGLLSSVFAGRRVAYLPAFSAEAWIEMAETEGVTHAMVVPTMLARIVGELKRVLTGPSRG